MFLSNGHSLTPSTVVTMLKPYSFSTQFLLSNSHHSLPFPFRFTQIDFVSQSQWHPSRAHQPIVCARSTKNHWRGWSNRKMLQLASTIALNLKIFPEPFNSLIAEIATADWNQIPPKSLILNPLAGRAKKTRRKSKLVWFVFVLGCVVGAGFLSWKISELDLFLRSVLFCLAGISLFRLCWGKKAVKEWFLGFSFGIVLMMSSKLGREDLKFWVQRLRSCSPLAQITIVNRNRNRNRNRRISK